MTSPQPAQTPRCESHAMEVEMSEVKGTDPCQRFIPGHAVHWIHAKKSREGRSPHPSWWRLVSCDDDGYVVIERNGASRQLWNHNPRTLRRRAAATQGLIEYRKEWGLLICHRGGTNYLFNVADPTGDLTPCTQLSRTETNAHP